MCAYSKLIWYDRRDRGHSWPSTIANIYKTNNQQLKTIVFGHIKGIKYQPYVEILSHHFQPEASTPCSRNPSTRRRWTRWSPLLPARSSGTPDRWLPCSTLSKLLYLRKMWIKMGIAQTGIWPPLRSNGQNLSNHLDPPCLDNLNPD